MSSIEIKYSVYEEDEEWKQLGFYAPEPVLKDIIKSRDKGAEYLKCPAFQDYYKNCFLIKSPVDLTIKVENINGTKIITTKEYDQDFFNKNVDARLDQNSTYSMLSLKFHYVFFSDEPVMLEQLEATMHKTKMSNNINLITGTYDISKWIRVVEFAVEILDDKKPIVIKRGDPLYYVRFVTDKNVVLTRVIDKDINKIAWASATTKKYMPGNTLERNYEMAKEYVEIIKSKFFKKKSKCPFGFLRRKDE
jgi:hypothetical protein